MLKRLGAVGLALAVAGSAWFFTRSSSETPTAFGGNCKDESVETFAVKVVPAKTVYSAGQVARFKATVTRIVRTDERDKRAELGPAEGATITVSLSLASKHLRTSEAITNADGKARLRVRVPASTPSGSIDVFAEAKKASADVACVPSEMGSFDAPGLIRVKE